MAVHSPPEVRSFGFRIPARTNPIQFSKKIVAISGNPVAPSHLVCYIPLSLFLRVTQGSNPGSELFGDGFAFSFEIPNSGFQIPEGWHRFEQTQHGPNFSDGAARDIKKRQQFLVRPSLKALRNVV